MSHTRDHSWSRIFGVFATGVAIAFLVGKVPAALPALREELGLTLFEAGLLVAMLSLIAAFGGVVIGALSASAGQRRTAIVGLVVAIGAGIGGAMASGATLLLAMRALEGIGFFMVSVSLPGLIIQLADDRRRQSAMGLWGAYLPAGAGLILLVGGGVIASIGWQGLWVLISGALAVMSLVVMWAAPAPPRKGQLPSVQKPVAAFAVDEVAKSVAATLRAPGAVMLAVTFGCYSGQYLALTAFVPLILVEQAGWTLPSAAAAGAVVMIVNAAGNVAAGILLDRGVARFTLVLVAAAAMALGAILVMSEVLPVALRLAGAAFFSCFGGLIPGALFAGVRQHAPAPQYVSTVNGLMLQAVAIGQFIGPALASYLVGAGGGNWTWSLYYLLPMAILTALAGMKLGQIERRGKLSAGAMVRD